VHEIDFHTALGRLLRDAQLREEFALDPSAVAARLRVRAEERAPFAALSSEELGIQAMILVRKRFDAVRRLIPATMAELGERGWELFRAHAHGFWPEAPAGPVRDTEQFCARLSQSEPRSLCTAEMNRLRFHTGEQPLAVHLVRDLLVRGRARRAVQLFVRHRRGWSEHAIHFAWG
jgi:hypothetical protein